jgi:hypothetical protein
MRDLGQFRNSPLSQHAYARPGLIVGAMPVAMRGRRTKGRLRWPRGTMRCQSRKSANDGLVGDRSNLGSCDHRSTVSLAAKRPSEQQLGPRHDGRAGQSRQPDHRTIGQRRWACKAVKYGERWRTRQRSEPACNRQRCWSSSSHGCAHCCGWPTPGTCTPPPRPAQPLQKSISSSVFSRWSWKPRKLSSYPSRAAIARSVWTQQTTGGRGGIRTHGTLAGTPVFKTGALNHSATLPSLRYQRLTQSLLEQAGNKIPVWTQTGLKLARSGSNLISRCSQGLRKPEASKELRELRAPVSATS